VRDIGCDGMNVRDKNFGENKKKSLKTVSAEMLFGKKKLKKKNVNKLFKRRVNKLA
jgi:hypothetical protein